jgi:hypothetical protein
MRVRTLSLVVARVIAGCANRIDPPQAPLSRSSGKVTSSRLITVQALESLGGAAEPERQALQSLIQDDYPDDRETSERIQMKLEATKR